MMTIVTESTESKLGFGKQKAKDSLTEAVAAGSLLRCRNEKYNKTKSGSQIGSAHMRNE